MSVLDAASVGAAFGTVSLAAWLYLAVLHGRFWRPPLGVPEAAAPAAWPAVVAVIPARNEAAVLPETLPRLLAQRYPGPLRVIVVDDDSDDGTGEVAHRAGADVVRTGGPPAGWTGKVAALAAGVAAAGDADFLLFTDADIDYPPDALRRLVAAEVERELVLISQMVRLRADTFWERLLVPAFVYFFAQLYPFARVNAGGRTAAAAGGCMLVQRRALERAGGLAAIHDAIIDDVALGRLLKRHGRIWLGLALDVRSVRPYPTLAELWRMVTRSAYTQLRYSPLLLSGTVLGLAIVYLVPPVLCCVALATASWPLAALGALSWVIMAATYVPMLRCYGLAGWRAVALPGVALLYLVMTLDSARRHAAGRGGEWKGRFAAS